MAQFRKILISLPDNLLKEVDYMVSVEKTNRSQFVREAMKSYIRERKKVEVRNVMMKGYMEMANVNVEFAEISFYADSDQLMKYEKRLGELEQS